VASKTLSAAKKTHMIVRPIIEFADVPRSHKQCTALFVKIAERMGKQDLRARFMPFPGGIIACKWPETIRGPIDLTLGWRKRGHEFVATAEEALEIIIGGMPRAPLRAMSKRVRFSTFGIDAANEHSEQKVELVLTFDWLKKKVVHVTGKSHPTGRQENLLIRVTDLSTHFTVLDRRRVMILGCHDLTMFSPRAKATTKDWKLKRMQEMLSMARKHEPSVVLHHPHQTDTPRTWLQQWSQVRKDIPSVKHYASGIRYSSEDDECRAPLEKVLEFTHQGDCVELNI
jgi:hypothetical protein